MRQDPRKLCFTGFIVDSVTLQEERQQGNGNSKDETRPPIGGSTDFPGRGLSTPESRQKDWPTFRTVVVQYKKSAGESHKRELPAIDSYFLLCRCGRQLCREIETHLIRPAPLR